MHTIKINISRSDLESKRAKLADSGFPILGDSGTVTRFKITLDYSYNERLETLTFVIIEKPRLVSFVFVENRIRDWLSIAQD